NLFIAKKGSVDDGAKYIDEAISAGAAAILTDMANPFLKGVAQLVHLHVEAMEAKLAARFYGCPSEEIEIVGIGGTSGKTTTAYLVKHLLDGLSLSSGLIGSIEYIIGKNRFVAERTTPDAITNQKMLREMVRQRCAAAVMEVTSHGLAQGRCDEIHFDWAIF